MRGFFARILWAFTLILLLAPPAQAQELDYSAFKRLPVLHDGRVKPLDSFARHYLQVFHGKERLDGRPAIDWLAASLFDPAQSAERPLFLIRNPRALGLAVEARNLSYLELTKALGQRQDAIATLLRGDPDNWNADQRALIDYHFHAESYAQLLRSLTMMLPLAIAPPDALAGTLDGQGGRALTYSDINRHAELIDKRVRAIIRRKGDDPARYTDEEKSIVDFAFAVSAITGASGQSFLLRILPDQRPEQAQAGEWVSPWAMQESGAGGPHIAAYLESWQAMAAAWQTHDESAWKQAVTGAHHAIAPLLDKPATHRKLHAEVVYNQLHPLGLAMSLYLAAFLAIVLYALSGRPACRLAAWVLALGGLAANAAAIGLRIYILARPPVGTLYESIIFVALVAALGALVFGRRGDAVRGLIAASLVGGILLFLAEAFAGDDTMKMLVAVLNTNFWLATHVLTITIGYGWCLVAALYAHFYLIARAAGRLDDAQRAALFTQVKTLALIALLFTTVGTILGGIWADQSWGRFWGWDPKENGALLIVLWLVWCLHGAVAGQLRRLTFMVAMAALAVIVALAWFGVNLLNTGLHSYGFIEGVALALAAFCAFEILLIGGLWGMIAHRERAAS